MTVFSSIDVHGRYAFANQPAIANWNLARLAETLMPLMSEDRDEAVRLAQGAIDAFPGLFRSALTEVLRAKLGLAMPREDDLDLAETLFDAMANGKADFTLLFRRLCDAAADESADASVRALFAEPQLFDDWAARWRERLAEETRAPDERRVAMRRVNPAFIARNHRVEQAIRAAVDRDDLAPFHRLNAVLARPFDDQPENADYMSPPLPDEIVQQTFCGT
jgi:uncharacterized protein YdiU (UPF0061 family)